MSATPTWAAVKRHAEERVAQTMETLAVAPLDKVPALQAEVRVWKSVLALPNTLAPDTQLDPTPVAY